MFLTDDHHATPVTASVNFSVVADVVAALSISEGDKFRDSAQLDLTATLTGAAPFYAALYVNDVEVVAEAAVVGSSVTYSSLSNSVLNDLSVGAHKLGVRYRDANGSNATMVNISVVSDMSAGLSIAEGSNYALGSSFELTATLAGDGAIDADLYLNNALIAGSRLSVAPYTWSTVTVTELAGLVVGNHALEVRYSDQTGSNAESVNITIVDSVAIALSIVDATKYRDSAAVDLTAALTGEAPFFAALYIDDALAVAEAEVVGSSVAWTSALTPSLANLSLGSHKLEVRARR